MAGQVPFSPARVQRTELPLDPIRLDTADADPYRQRARQLAASEFSELDFKALRNAEKLQKLAGDLQQGGSPSWTAGASGPGERPG
jgi:hypothetical protein